MAKRGPKGPSKYTPEFIEAQAVGLLAYAEKAPLPLLKEFAWIIKIPSQYVSEWSNEKSDYYNVEFSEALKQFKDIQETKWCLAMANGDVPPAPGIFILKNISQMRDERHIKGEGFENHSHLTMILPQMKELPEEVQTRIKELKTNGLSNGNGSHA